MKSFTRSDQAGMPRLVIEIMKATRLKYWPAVGIPFAIGVLLSSTFPTFLEVFVALSVFVFALAGSGHILNQYYDRHLDPDNPRTKNLPIASGRLSKQTALFSAVILLLLGFFASFYLGFELFVLYLIGTAASVAYSVPPFRLKGRFVLGATTSALSYILIGLYAGWLLTKSFSLQPLGIGFPIIFAALSAHIYKDVEDMKGDKKHGVRTVATRLGSKGAVKISWILSVIGYALFPVFSALGFLSPYFVWLGFGVLPSTLFFKPLIASEVSQKNIRNKGWLLFVCLLLTLVIVLSLTFFTSPLGG